MTEKTLGEMTTEEALAHFGVKGMKWGSRKAVSRADIKGARKSVRKDARGVLKEQAKRVVGKSSKETVHNKKVSFLMNPDRSTAARLTKGETAVMAILNPGVIGGSQLQSRLITSRQAEGYTKDNGKLKRRIINA